MNQNEKPVKWISYDEWKHLKDWERKKAIETLPNWMIYFLYASTMMDIESNFEPPKLTPPRYNTGYLEHFEWDIMKENPSVFGGLKEFDNEEDLKNEKSNKG